MCDICILVFAVSAGFLNFVEVFCTYLFKYEYFMRISILLVNIDITVV